MESGETFVILQAEKAIAELRPIANDKQLRPFGLCAGEFTGKRAKAPPFKAGDVGGRFKAC